MSLTTVWEKSLLGSLASEAKLNVFFSKAHFSPDSTILLVETLDGQKTKLCDIIHRTSENSATGVKIYSEIVLRTTNDQIALLSFFRFIHPVRYISSSLPVPLIINSLVHCRLINGWIIQIRSKIICILTLYRSTLYITTWQCFVCKIFYCQNTLCCFDFLPLVRTCWQCSYLLAVSLSRLKLC